jgi:subtilase family serine protease
MTTPLGTYRLLACADDLNDVLELVETNNCRSSTGLVVVVPDDTAPA